MEVEQRIEGSGLWSLLVGIDEYMIEKNLRGCVNDVQAMRTFLIDRLKVPEGQICVLVNQEASRAGILNAFQDFLINNPAIQPNAQMLFHYSGHGSQMLDPTHLEPDGYNETIVAYDSRTTGVYDIPDKTLATLLDQLAVHKGNNITVILDCCHSGSGTRHPETSGTVQARLVAADDRLPPIDLDADLWVGMSRHASGRSGWPAQGIPYVLLAGCRDRELAYEYWDNVASSDGAWHGAFTYILLQCMRQMAADTTYVELHERVATRVNALYPSQTPQCEGERERMVFGSVYIQRDPFISIRQVEDDFIILDAGLVHGLRQGTQLALYPPEVRTHDMLPLTPLATVIVTSVTATTAHCHVQRSQRRTIPVHARAVITVHIHKDLRQNVAFQAEEGEVNRDAIERLFTAIQHVTLNDQASPYLKVVDNPDQTTYLRVMAADGQLTIYGANNELLVKPEVVQEPDRNSVLATVHALESIARYTTVLALSNEDASSQLAGKIKLHLRRLIQGPQGPQGEELPRDSIVPNGELTITFDPLHDERNMYVVDVINNSSQCVYPHVFIMNPDYSIQRLYPEYGQQEALEGNHTLSLGLGTAQTGLHLYLPDDWNTCYDCLKVVVTTAPGDLQVLEQDGLNVPPGQVNRRIPRGTSASLEQLLDVVFSGEGTRFGRPIHRLLEEDWTTTKLSIAVVRTPI